MAPGFFMPENCTIKACGVHFPWAFLVGQLLQGIRNMWKYFLNNPVGRSVEDCTVRALSKALNISWDEAHRELAEASRQMGDMMHSTSVLSALLRKNGFTRHAISNICPDCYTIEDFAYDHPYGTYVVGTGTHVVTVENGDIWDSWDSSLEIPQFYWKR